ncbi:hypothetical protein HDU78_007212 [Chytriomyces hyalinus]|nr:hypothetical protein HDU78_007212 [Chytriomyces hyalinus]
MNEAEVLQQIEFNKWLLFDINQGWNSVKIVGMTVIPYCYTIFPKSFIWNTLMFGAVCDYVHAITVFCAFTISRTWPRANVQHLWILQCTMAAFVRIVEIVYNAKILQAVNRGRKLPLWLIIWFGIGSLGILFGRIFDAVVSATFLWGVVALRLGMAIVSVFSLLSSLPVIYFMGAELYRVYKINKEDGGADLNLIVLQSAALRLIFLNLIDVGLLVQFLMPQAVGMAFARWFFDNWDNSRLSYYAVDALLSRLVEDRVKATVASANSRGSGRRSILSSGLSKLRNGGSQAILAV